MLPSPATYGFTLPYHDVAIWVTSILCAVQGTTHVVLCSYPECAHYSFLSPLLTEHLYLALC